jgi:cancer susceptibility candidate protein 1
MALAIPSFTLASSSLNAKAAKDICVMRIQEIPEPLYPPTFEKVSGKKKNPNPMSPTINYTTIKLQIPNFVLLNL